MEFLRDGEYLESMVAKQCTFGNKFHRSQGGCVLLRDDNGRKLHLYNKIDISQVRDGSTILDKMQFNTEYVTEKYVDAAGYRLFTILEGKCQSLHKVCQHAKTLKSFITTHNQFYLDKVKTLLGEYHLHPRVLYDIVVDNDHIILLRPTKIIHDDQFFTVGQRLAFIRMLSMYSKSAEAKKLYMDRKDAVKDKLICSPSYFTNARTSPPELRCEYLTSANCSHIFQNSVNHVTLLRIPQKPSKLCRFLLDRMIKDHGEQAVTTLFDFRCHLANADNTDDNDVGFDDRDEDAYTENIPLVFAFNIAFKRNVHVHRLCLPDEFLGKGFLEWFYDLIDVTV